MIDKPQTQKDMLVTLLDSVLVLTKEVTEVKSQVVEITHTIHNGMSHAIQDTQRQVTDMTARLDKIDATGHPQSCPFLQDRDRRKRHLSSGWKMAIALVGLGGGLWAWVQFFSRIRG